MKIARECIHCLARQAVEIAEKATSDPAKQEIIIKQSLTELSIMDFDSSSPEIAFKMHQHAKNITGVEDPYLQLKAQYNQIAENISERIRSEKWIEKAEDPFDIACRLSIAGNIIDFSVGLELEASDIVKSVEDSIQKELFGTGSKTLKEAVANAKRVMFIADNSGEIVFDKFLLEQLPLDKVTYVVKGGPIVNDATMDDAVHTGVTNMVRVIDNGHSAQGTVMHDCSQSFRDEFDASDLIISKGQANYETLSDIKSKSIHYLLRAKCKSISNDIGCSHLDYVLTHV